MSRLLELTELFLDQSLEGDQKLEFEQLYQPEHEDFKAASELIEHDALLIGMMAENDESLPQQVIKEIETKSDQKNTDAVMDYIRKKEGTSVLEESPVNIKSIVYKVIALAAFLTLALVVPGKIMAKVKTDSFATLSDLNGPVTIVRNGKGIDGERGVELYEGDVVKSDGQAEITLVDKSTIRLLFNTEIKMSKDKDDWSIDLNKGVVDLVVTKQKGTFGVNSAAMNVVVVGTEFSLDYFSGSSHLKVKEGHVRAKPVTAKSFVDVYRGQELSSNKKNLDYDPRKIQKWMFADFEKSLPEGDLYGNIKSTKNIPLGNNSEFAIEAVKTDVMGSKVMKGVYLINKRGVFTYKKNQYVRFKYWMNEHGHWLGVFMRSELDKITAYGSKKPVFGKWQEVEFSMEEILPKVENKPFKYGDVITHIHLMTDGSNETEFYIDDLSIIQK
ncbi:MAG: FecR family protein [Lentisphaeraceae bacterium]|nr:FecR family protein [Lentisphaeraceae bacterium]